MRKLDEAAILKRTNEIYSAAKSFRYGYDVQRDVASDQVRALLKAIVEAINADEPEVKSGGLYDDGLG